MLVEVLEGLPDEWTGTSFRRRPASGSRSASWRLVEVPKKYNAHGVHRRPHQPVRPVGACRGRTCRPASTGCLLRSRSAARLYIDDKLVVENPFPDRARPTATTPTSRSRARFRRSIRPLQPGDQEQDAEIELTGGTHRLKLEVFVGGKKRRPEVGETSVSIAPAGSDDFWVMAGEPGP